jgi:hypothetical protein
MTQLSTEIKTHVIITFNKNKYFITDRQHEQIKQMSDNQKFNVNGETINTSSIAEIISVERYSDNEKTYHSNYSMPIFRSSIFGSIKRESAKRSMINGFKQHFSGREMPENAKKILKRMEEIAVCQ